MRTSRIRYIVTWVALIVLMICSTLLLASVWNSHIGNLVSPLLLAILWIGILSAGIYLFMLAVKKAHRQWIDEERHLERVRITALDKKERRTQASRENKSLDFAAVARKIVRRVPDNIAQEQLGTLLLKNLSRELELMSGIFYREQKGIFMIEASYALASGSKPGSFKSGEGLTGQAARNKQLMMLTQLPEGYLEVFSGLGKAPPTYLVLVPLVHKDRTIALLECSGYRYEPADIEKMFRILARDLMDKLAPNL